MLPKAGHPPKVWPSLVGGYILGLNCQAEKVESIKTYPARITHGTNGIYLPTWKLSIQINGKNVGKYTGRPMDGMGNISIFFPPSFLTAGTSSSDSKVVMALLGYVLV